MANELRVVFDANVFISAVSGETCSKALMGRPIASKLLAFVPRI
ncbi:MAG TPA: hypothetical protein VFE46_08100 [Pirellulales bacterium]|jgi:predicted nucleic acid-binding protein|nr:hypothetical protein [Pirellulales bacterium]